MNGVRPLHDRIIVQRLEDGEQHIGGIIIPDTAKEKAQQGTVIAVGSGLANDNGKRVALDLKRPSRAASSSFGSRTRRLTRIARNCKSGSRNSSAAWR